MNREKTIEKLKSLDLKDIDWIKKECIKIQHESLHKPIIQDNLITLKSKIVTDDYTDIANRMFDVPREEESVTIIKNNIQMPDAWNIGLIYGESGSGKSTLLKQFGSIKEFEWSNEKSIISELNSVTPAKASEILSSVGLSTIPAWLRPYHALSNGQQFRANLARTIAESSEKEIILIDEFTSVVDRNVAKAASNAIQKYIRKENKKIILASCHKDIIEWLQPDWIYNPTEATTHALPRESLRRPEISLKVFRGKYEAWELFKHHHYLSNSLNKSSRIFLFYWENNLVGIVAALSFPHAVVKKAWRESRTVILPDFQGLSIGTKISDYVGSMVKAQGGKWYSRTTHPAMIHYRLKHKELWRVTGKGKTAEMGKNSTKSDSWKKDDRFCYSFEYIGPESSQEESNLFWSK